MRHRGKTAVTRTGEGVNLRLGRAACCCTRRPRPLKVETAQVARDIDHLADEVSPRTVRHSMVCAEARWCLRRPPSLPPCHNLPCRWSEREGMQAALQLIERVMVQLPAQAISSRSTRRSAKPGRNGRRAEQLSLRPDRGARSGRAGCRRCWPGDQSTRIGSGRIGSG